MAKKETNLTLGISEPQKVDEFIGSLNHPLLDLVLYIRTFILEVDQSIGEGILLEWPYILLYWKNENI